MKVLVTCAACLLCHFHLFAESFSFEDMALEPGMSIKGLTFPISGAGYEKPPVVVKVEEISLQRAKIGFLSIAVVPRIVFKNFCLIIRDPIKKGESWCSALSLFLINHSLMDHADIEGFEIQCIGEHQEILVRARSGKFFPFKRQINLKDVLWSERAVDKLIPSAILMLEGPFSGCLCWIDKGEWRHLSLGKKSP